MNRVDIIGNLGRDPEIHHMNDGGKAVNMSIATTERWTDRSSGDRRERSEWHRIVAFGPIADLAERYLRKGSKCRVTGALKTRKWQGQDGQDRYTTEVVLSGPRAELEFLDRKSDSSGGGESYSDWQAPAQETGRPPIDDEIPF